MGVIEKDNGWSFGNTLWNGPARHDDPLGLDLEIELANSPYLPFYPLISMNLDRSIGREKFSLCLQILCHVLIVTATSSRVFTLALVPTQVSMNLFIVPLKHTITVCGPR